MDEHPRQRIDELAKKPNNKLFVRKELKKLPDMLHEDEEVVNLAQGRYEGNEGLIAVTDRRVMYVDEGIVRRRREDFPYERISSVQSSSGMVFGKIIIFGSGNKAEIDNVAPKQQAETIAEYIRMRIAPGQDDSARGTAPAGNDPDVYDKLRKLGELRDAGVLTDDEFSEKKAQLLADL